jgi:GT2 family glycosyltransferase
MTAYPNEPQVTVLVVNWNGAEFLPACLRSVAAQQGVGAVEVVVVDNGSTDGSLELLAREFPAARVLRNAVNNYAGANNLGVDVAAHDLVCLLNSDAELEGGCLAALAAALLGEERAAAAMPKVVFPDGRLYTTGVHERSDLYWVDRDHGAPDDGRRDRPERVFGVSGCCALWRRSAWRDLGGLDEDFHMYYEDVDLSLRARSRGFALLYEPRARVRHVGHGSIGKTAHGKDPLGERNRLLVLARHYPTLAARECARSPYLSAAPVDEVERFLPVLARHFGGDAEAFLAEVRRHLAARRPPGRWSLRRRWHKIRAGLDRWRGRA